MAIALAAWGLMRLRAGPRVKLCGLAAVQIAEAALESARTNQPVKLESLAEAVA